MPRCERCKLPTAIKVGNQITCNGCGHIQKVLSKCRMLSCCKKTTAGVWCEDHQTRVSRERNA